MYINGVFDYNYLKTFIFYNMQKQYWCEIYCFMSDI